jgi:hypothetical protein
MARVTSLGELIPWEFRSPGMSPAELRSAQAAAATRFPPDLCQLLSETLPVGPHFPDWRNSATYVMEEWRSLLIDLFDREEMEAAPALVPIYRQLGIPNEPLMAGNPVYSVYSDTDVVYIGWDLRSALLSKFHPYEYKVMTRPDSVRRIRFWTDIVERNR